MGLSSLLTNYGNQQQPMYQNAWDQLTPEQQAAIYNDPNINQSRPGTYTTDSMGNKVMSGGGPVMTGPDYVGMPGSPVYNSIYNPATQGLADPLNSRLNGINTNPLDMSVQNFADLANRKGPSAWATSAGDQQNALAQNQLERGANETAGQTAQALSNLGSSGGISSGARERVAEGGANNYMNMSQNTGRQNSLNQMQIGVNDQQNKMQEMGMLPGMEAAALQPEFQKANMWENAKAQDVGNQIANTQSANTWNQNLYGQQMGAWGASKNADALAKSAKGPSIGISYICGALKVRGLITKKEYKLMSTFLKKALLTRPDFVLWYWKHAPKAVALATQQNYDFSQIKKKFVDDVILIQALHGLTGAQDWYGTQAGDFIKMFTGEDMPVQFYEVGILKKWRAYGELLKHPSFWTLLRKVRSEA
jgi:hypothetical protein